MEFFILLALILLNYQFYKLSNLLLTIDQQSLDIHDIDTAVQAQKSEDQ